MEVQAAMLARRSIRKFTDVPVAEEEINALLHAATAGPSACNCRPWEFYVVCTQEVLERLHAASRFSNIAAPLAIVVCGNLDRALPRQLAPFWIQDCSAATENILLAATDLGLGAVWCGIHPQEKAEAQVRQILQLPDTQIPLNIIYIGHPAQAAEPRDQYDAACIHFL